MLQQHLRFRHFSGSRIFACQISHCRLDHLHSVMLQDSKIILHDRIFIHSGIHGRSHKNRTLAGKRSCRQHIICNSVRKLCDHIGTGRRNHQKICLLCQSHMFYIKLKIAVKRIDQTLMGCQSLKRDRIDKIFCILGHQYMYICLLLDKRTGQICNFICCNTSGHSQKNRFIL